MILIEVGLNRHMTLDFALSPPVEAVTLKFPARPHVAVPFVIERDGSDVVQATEFIAAGELDCPYDSVTASCVDCPKLILAVDGVMLIAVGVGTIT